MLDEKGAAGLNHRRNANASLMCLYSIAAEYNGPLKAAHARMLDERYNERSVSALCYYFRTNIALDASFEVIRNLELRIHEKIKAFSSKLISPYR